MTTRVQVYLYDLSQGIARTMSMGLTGSQIDGIWHTSVVIFGREWWYGQGIMNAAPGTTMHGNPVEKIDMGETEIPEEVFMELIDSMRVKYGADSYHLLDNNCNNFSSDLCNFLVGRFPDYITNLPADFLNTPFGQMMRPMIENMFGPSRVAQNTPPPAIQPTIPSLQSQQLLSSISGADTGIVPFMTDLSLLQQSIQNNTAVVVYFTSATCPPCRVIAPIFDEMVLSKGKEIVGIKVDTGIAQSIGATFEVRSTPTFMFFLRGTKFSQFSGANQAELRSSIDLLIYSAHPAHPHTLLSLPQYKGLSGTPILFPSLDSVDPIFAKLKTFLPAAGAEDSLSEAEVKQLDKIQAWLHKRNTAKKAQSAEPSMGELGATWKPLLGKILNLLPYDNQFPALDIVRMLILHNRVAEVYAKDGNLTIVNLLKNVASKDSEGSKPSALMTLRIACNAFSTPLLGTYVLSSIARDAIKRLLVTTLLSPATQQRQTAASLAFDISVKVAQSRSQKTDTVTPTVSGGPLEHHLDEDWIVECLSAIGTAIEKEDSEEIIHRLVASVGNFLYKEETHAGAVLLSILGLIETLDSKISAQMVKSANVVGLCREVQEMIRTAVAENERSNQ
ncbi:hypothetical protein BGZ93_004957 [Podila epicladia]|nr:hypothetical protein BGZ92_003954 [Podila epicladia]KAG0096146.1 hypothetical protein BGZ93_004957 [Podila epicladia]